MPEIALNSSFFGTRAAWRARFETASLPALIGLALLSLAWLIPGHYLPWMMFQQESLAAAGGLLLCWAAVEKGGRVVWPIPAVVALLTAFVPWVQFGFHEVRFLTDAFLASAYMVALTLSLATGATLASSAGRDHFFDGWTACCVTAALLSTGMALYQWLQLPPVGDWLSQVMPGGRVFANLAQPNHLSSVLALGLAGVLRWYERRRIGAAGAAFAAVFLAWGIAMTESRTGWMFMAVLAIGTGLLRRRAQLRTPLYAVAAGVLVFGVMVVLEGRLHAIWTQSGVVAGVRTAVGTRAMHWPTLLDAAMQSPWFGYGWNQVAAAQYATALAHPATGEALMHSHNLLLDLVLYNGLPLGLLLSGLLVWWTGRALRRCRSADAWCLLAALLALLAHAMVEYPLHYLYFLIPAGLTMGAVHTLVASIDAPLTTRPRVTLWLPALLMLGALAFVGVEYLRAEEALRRLRFANARVGIKMADLRTPDLALLDGWKAYHEAARLRLQPGMSASEIELLKDVARRFPYPAALHRYAQALALNGQSADALDVLTHLCKVYPGGVQQVMREAWQEQQAQEQRLLAVTFPRCDR
jgi:O-antigen ligase